MIELHFFCCFEFYAGLPPVPLFRMNGKNSYTIKILLLKNSYHFGVFHILITNIHSKNSVLNKNFMLLTIFSMF